jgi:4-aminobutyrate aminotransferase
MIGIDLPDHDAAEAMERACFDRGLLILTCGERSVRMAPPLVVTIEQANVALEIFAAALASLETSASSPTPAGADQDATR